MTENKRFILTEQFNGLQGVTFVKDDYADVDTYYTVDGTVDLLNELNDENKQLRFDFNEMKELLHTLEDENKELKEENEQLKQRVEQLERNIEKYIDVKYRKFVDGEVGGWSNDELQKVKEENEQLKKDCSILVQSNQEYRKENEELKQTLRIYRRVANCRNCDYHDYDCREDGDDFEICTKGKDMEDGICEDWREL